MKTDEKISVKGLHTIEMQDDELRGMLGETHLTLRRFMRLYLVRSPYIQGGTLDASTIAEAAAILDMDDDELEKIHDEIQHEIGTAMRVFEIPVPDETQKPKKTSEIRVFGPEWLSDTVSLAAKALPSLTWEDALDMPLVLLLHLGMAALRASGQTTERPKGIKDAIKQLLARKKDG